MDVDGAGLSDPNQAGALAAYTYVQLIGAIGIFTEPALAPMGPMVDDGADFMDELIDEHAAEIIDPEERYGGPGGNLGDNLVLTHGFGSTRYDDTWRFNTATAQWENITSTLLWPISS